MMQARSKRGGARAGSGRKPLPEGEAMIPVVVRMRPEQKQKLKVLGGAAWIRSCIDDAKGGRT